MKKLLKVLMPLMIVAMLLAACGGAAEPAETEGEEVMAEAPTTVKIAFFFTGIHPNIVRGTCRRICFTIDCILCFIHILAISYLYFHLDTVTLFRFGRCFCNEYVSA